MSVPNIPSKINSYNVYNDAERLIGVGDEVTLPDFEAMAETISGAKALAVNSSPPHPRATASAMASVCPVPLQ